MRTSSKLLIILLCSSILLLTTIRPVAANPTNNLVLPTTVVFDTFYHRNMPITQYSFDQLDTMMGTAEFRRWNDMTTVCESVYIMFGTTSTNCAGLPVHINVRSAVARAYVSFTILPSPPMVIPVYTVDPAPPPQQSMMVVDPIYPPWSPTDNPY